ncbi:mitochondrial carrier protein-like protein [Mytilinidion resinicola]|uniref:Mitochondrial carrier protein-like protein n=1 Tax=Mytilinidion resinicola TaxID=574789 RepID=A0A6A6Y9S8_9PEZI|nr:mitochondrial carrier protein-like protein [Mytilinidion resinicola]KAF2805318.1 mitochondrial carrier protein-like protein [Mytilinidion resinicola]
MRAVTARAVAFYFRAPIKAFFPGRIDYMGYARAINPRVQANLGWSWKVSTPALLAHAVKTYGWRFLPNQVLPPMLGNTLIGAILYTAYLQALGSLHEPSSRSAKRIFPPPSFRQTFSAGLIAGGIQSLVAAPLDALQVRFRTADMLEGKYKTMWQYATHKLHDIGLRGIFGGFTLSLLKDSLGAALFFSTFECVKSQAYYSFVTHYYGVYSPTSIFLNDRPVIKPHYTVEPAFLLLAGMTASVAQQAIQHPLSELQNVHYGRLESLDYQAHEEMRPKKTMSRYYHAYEKTIEQCQILSRRAGGWRRYLYKNFFMNTIRQVPSTSAGLIIFELVRRKFAFESEEVRIEKDGFDILLT